MDRRRGSLCVLISMIIGLLALGCVRERLPERRPRPTVGPVVTRVLPPAPIPTQRPDAGVRTLATPVAAVILDGETEVWNYACTGDCVMDGRASLVTQDLYVVWEHEDPVMVDYYELWRDTAEPYFEPDSCTTCTMVTTTTGLAALSEDSPPGWNPVGGTTGSDIRSEMDFYLVRAVNSGGASEISNRIGVVSWSLMQGSSDLPTP